jgi:hypothetical protein
VDYVGFRGVMVEFGGLWWIQLDLAGLWVDFGGLG